MRFAIQASAQEGVSWDRWRSFCRMAEELGFDGLYRSDHFFSYFSDKTKDSLETWVSLAVAARETRRVRIGTLGCPVTFRHPALLARMAAQVDALSGGRLELGVGAGHGKAEHTAFGIPMPPVNERMDRLEEEIQVLRALWGPGPASFDGRYYQLKDAECYPKPAQSPMRLLVGGRGERRTMRIAAKYADHWNATSSTPEVYEHKLSVLRSHCADLGRDFRAIHCSVMTGFVIGRDRSELHGHARAIMAAMPMLGDDPAEAVQRLREMGWPAGTPDEVTEAVARFREIGAGEIMFQHLDFDNRGSLELLAQQVMPRFR